MHVQLIGERGGSRLRAQDGADDAWGVTDLLGDEARFRHAEGNSGAHALTSLVGPSVSIPIHSGRLVLGRWQAVYFCEFDGPRQRTMHVQVIGERGGSREVPS